MGVICTFISLLSSFISTPMSLTNLASAVVTRVKDTSTGANMESGNTWCLKLSAQRQSAWNSVISTLIRNLIALLIY